MAARARTRPAGQRPICPMIEMFHFQVDPTRIPSGRRLGADFLGAKCRSQLQTMTMTIKNETTKRNNVLSTNSQAWSHSPDPGHYLSYHKHNKYLTKEAINTPSPKTPNLDGKWQGAPGLFGSSSDFFAKKLADGPPSSMNPNPSTGGSATMAALR
eukprot:COSAG02_NODE_3360_length_6871_cov_3.468104_2_plen_156_part_00